MLAGQRFWNEGGTNDGNVEVIGVAQAHDRLEHVILHHPSQSLRAWVNQPQGVFGIEVLAVGQRWQESHGQRQ